MNLTSELMELIKDKKGYKTIYNNLNKENYWLIWLDDKNNTNVYGFEHNSYLDVPEKDYHKIKELLTLNGLVYVYDIAYYHGGNDDFINNHKVTNERLKVLNWIKTK
jgi:hypothetical protein